MKQILLLCSLSCFLILNASAQTFGDLKAKDFKKTIDKSLRIGNKYIQENASNIRTGEPILLDSIALDDYDLEAAEFEEVFLYAFVFEEVDGKLRYDSILVTTDLSASPIPIQGVSGKVNYDEQGRYTGYRIIAETALFDVDFFELIIEYDAQGKVVLNKSIPNPLLGEAIFGDSIVYTHDGEGRVTSWVKYNFEEVNGSSFASESFQNITYGDDGIMNSYIHVLESEFDTTRTRYTDVVFYQPSEDQAHALLDSDISIEDEFYPVGDFNPLNDLKRLQLENNLEVWNNNDWTLFTTRTFEYRGDTLVTFTEEQPNIYIEIEEYAFDASGKLLSRTVIIDPIVVPLTPEFRNLFEYDGNGNILNHSWQFFAEGRWEEYFREEYEYEYDDENEISELRYFEYSDGELSYGERYRIWGYEEPTVSVRQPTQVSFEAGMYPNPVVSESNLVIKGLAGELVDLFLTDMSGRIVINQKLNIVGDEMNKSLQFTDVPAGNYVLVVAHHTGRVAIPMIKM